MVKRVKILYYQIEGIVVTTVRETQFGVNGWDNAVHNLVKTVVSDDVL